MPLWIVAFVDVTCISKHLWNATPGEALTCLRERGNGNDVFAVAAKWQCKAMAILLGIYLSKFLGVCLYERLRVFVRFLYVLRGGVLNCLITGSRRYSRDFPQGASYQEVCIDGA